MGVSVAWGPFTWANQACWLVLVGCSLLTALLVEWEGGPCRRLGRAESPLGCSAARR